MKIFAGLLQGMKIIGKQNSLTTRPTSAKVREAIMHIIHNELQDTIFMDLFSGSGCLGLEAMSRGARGCYFVEKDINAIKLLKKNISNAKDRLSKQGHSIDFAQVVHADVNKLLAKKNTNIELPDIIWADPPYSYTLTWLKLINKTKPLVFQKAKLFVLEIHKDLSNDKNIMLANWLKIKQKDYGNTSVIFFERKGEVCQ